MKKHAYLIMVHNELYVFEKLIRMLDDSRNDLYIHVDKKLKSFDFDKYRNMIKKSNVIFVKRMDVKWGTDKQIKCSIMLLEESLKKHHAYYHFISGVDLPIKSQDYIHNKLDKENKDFIAFDNLDIIKDNYVDRIKYYHLFGNLWRNKKTISKYARSLKEKIVSLQRELNVNRIKNLNLTLRKGANWFSITEDTANYIVSKKDFVKHFKHTYCADELFVQTIIYNSKYMKNVYIKNNKSNYLRYIDWEKGSPAVLSMEDYEIILKDDSLFARKFSVNTDKEIIDKIYDRFKE